MGREGDLRAEMSMRECEWGDRLRMGSYLRFSWVGGGVGVGVGREG